jgi:hypothetical protein
MKNLIFSSVALAAILFLFSSCSQETKTELTDKQKEAIISEVKQVFEYTLGGIENRDAERAFSSFSKKESARLVQEGYIVPDIDAEKSEYAKGFSKPGPKTKITCDPLYFDVLTENTVFVTTIGSIASVENTNPDEKPWVIAYTMLFKKEAEGWKVHNMHMSWK